MHVRTNWFIIVKRVILRKYKVLVDHVGPMEFYRGGGAESTLQFNNTNSSLHVLPSDAATLNSRALRFHIHLRHGKGATSYNYQVSFVWFCVSARKAAMFGFGGIPLMCDVAARIRAILRLFDKCTHIRACMYKPCISPLALYS